RPGREPGIGPRGGTRSGPGGRARTPPGRPGLGGGPRRRRTGSAVRGRAPAARRGRGRGGPVGGHAGGRRCPHPHRGAPGHRARRPPRRSPEGRVVSGSRGRRRRRIVARSLAAVAVPLAVTAGCSISTDDTPRGLAVSTTTTSAPASPTSGGASAQLWYVLDGSLVPVSASLPDHLLSTVMGSLFDAPDTESVGRDLTTSVPVDTKVEHLDLADGTLTVDLSGEFDNLVGPS